MIRALALIAACAVLAGTAACSAWQTGSARPPAGAAAPPWTERVAPTIGAVGDAATAASQVPSPAAPFLWAAGAVASAIAAAWGGKKYTEAKHALPPGMVPAEPPPAAG